MVCPKCSQAASNPEALLCEFCGELFKKAQPGPSADPPAAQAARATGPCETVTVTGGTIQIPSCCCCCLGPASKTRRTTAERHGMATVEYSSWEFPYCQKCYSHTVWWDASWIIGVIAGFAAAIGLMAIHGRAPTAAEIGRACAGGTAVGALVWIVLKPKRQAGCADSTHGVSVGSPGEDEYVFIFSNPQYGGLFSDLNG
jgi:hypothetical protein